MELESHKRTSRLAIASLMFVIGAIISAAFFCFLTFIGAHGVAGMFVAATVLFCGLAFLSGIAGIALISIHHKHLQGYVYAVLGIVLASPAIYVMYGIDSSVRLREERRRTNTGHYNLQVLGETMAAYAKAHDGYLPVAETWCDLLMEHNGGLSKDNFRHPLHSHPNLQLTGDCHFGYNKNVSGRRLSDLADDIVLLVEADGPWNLNGAADLLETRRSEHGFIYVLLADGTIDSYVYKYDAIRKYTSETDISYQKLRWKP